MGTWNNDDGLTVNFGIRKSESLRGGVHRTAGSVKEHVVEFTYDALPGSVNAASDSSYTPIPANAVPVEAILEVKTAFAGGTSYDIDLVDSAGATIGTGTDKLWDLLALADINAAGKHSVSSTHAGVNSGDALNVILASAGYLKVTAAGTFTAGKARITIRYVV